MAPAKGFLLGAEMAGVWRVDCRKTATSMSDSDSSVSAPLQSTPSRPRGRRRRSRLGRIRGTVQERSALILTILLAMSVVGSLLAVGTVHVLSLLFVAPVTIAAGTVAIWVEDTPRRRFPAPAVILALLGLYSLLQSVPLPLAWVSALSPLAAQTWTDALRLAEVPSGRWVSLSVEPGASRVEALKWLSYAALFVAAGRLSREKGAQRGVIILVGAALLGGVLCVVHGLFGFEDWLGLYSPQFARPPWAPAPLLNPNNFAGYLNLALFAATGLLFVRKQSAPRWTTALTIVLLAALVILTGSRGGVLALAVGFGLSGLAFRWQQRRLLARGHRPLPYWIPLSGLGVAAIGLAVIGATEVVWDSLLDETTGKLRIIEYSQRIIADHLWFGIGRGSFGTAFAAYRQELGDGIAQYAENFIVQWIVEWGLPVALAGLLGLLWTMRPSRHGFGRHPLQTAAYVAVTVLLLQNLVDLATEVAAVTLAAVALLGTIHGASSLPSNNKSGQGAASKATPRALVPSLIAASCCALSLALVFLVAKTGRPDSIEQRTALSETLARVVGKKKGDPAFAQARAEVKAALLRLPADPYVPLVGALLTRESGASPFTWLNQALRRDPLSARPHYLLAETLHQRGALEQALLTLKTSAKLSPNFVGLACDKALLWAPDLDMLLRVVPEGPAGIATLNALAARSAADPIRRERLIQQSLARSSRETSTNALAAQILLSALEQKAFPCVLEARARCEDQLRQHSAVVIASHSDPQLATSLKAQLLAYEGKYDAAEVLLAEACAHLPNPSMCNHERTRYAARLTDPNRFENAAMAYTASTCSNATACAAAFSWLGDLEVSRNNLLSALSRYERAGEELPTAAAWLRVAELAARLGRPGKLRSALSTARRLGGGPRVQELESRLEILQRERMLESLRK